MTKPRRIPPDEQDRLMVAAADLQACCEKILTTICNDPQTEPIRALLPKLRKDIKLAADLAKELGIPSPVSLSKDTPDQIRFPGTQSSLDHLGTWKIAENRLSQQIQNLELRPFVLAIEDARGVRRLFVPASVPVDQHTHEYLNRDKCAEMVLSIETERDVRLREGADPFVLLNIYSTYNRQNRTDCQPFNVFCLRMHPQIFESAAMDGLMALPVQPETQDPALAEMAQDVLCILVDNKTGPNARLPRERIADLLQKATGKDGISGEALGYSLDTLKELDLVRVKRYRGGGYWATEVGYRVASNIPRKHKSAQE